ncbi:uncharacterized protein [Solanum lycopersicum]|uniref:uncharacterized protein n=1 Tax=Solanum lycopersicum TaxID=4081 RepID=UPI0002BCBAF9
MVEIPSFDLGITQIKTQISGYTAAMELHKKSKDEIVRTPSKRKVGLTVKAIQKNCYKRRKVKNVVSDMIGEHAVNEVQDEVSEELKGIRFHVLARPIKPPRMQVYVNHNIVTDLKGKLTTTQFNHFKDTCFGAYTKMHVCGAQPQMFRCFMVCELEDSSTDELLFHINHTTLRFGIKEFAIITGLKCFGNKDDFLFDTRKPNRLINQYFEGKSIVIKVDLISKYKKKVWGGNDDDVVKFAILYFICTFIYSGEKKSSSIPRIHFDLVESGRYHEYSWGKDVFYKLLKSVTKKMDEKKKYYRIDGMPLAMQIWIYECCSAVDSSIAVKKSNRIPRIVNWMTRNSKIHYEFLMEECSVITLKFKNIEPSLKEIAFYQLESKSNANTENTFQIVSDKDDDEDDDFTSKPPSHKPHNKEKGSRLKDKRPTVLNGCRKAKSTTLNPDSNPLEDNVSVQEMHNRPDDSANRTPPRSSKEPQDTKADEIGLLRQDLASFKNYVNNEFKELQLLIMENFRQVMDALNRSCREYGAPNQEDATESPSHVPNWSNNNQISNIMDKPHCDANEVRTPRFVLQEHVKINVKEYLQPVQIHIQDSLTVHEQLNDINVFQNHDIQQPQSQIELIDALLPDFDAINPKKNDVVHSEVVVHPEGVVYDTTPVLVKRIRHPDRLTGDNNVIQNDGIQQPQSQFELLDALLPDIDTIYPKKNVVVHSKVVVRSEGGIYDNTPVPVQSIIHSDQLICSPYSTNIGSSSGSSYDVVKTYEKKHPFVSDFIQGPYNYNLFDDYCLWLSKGLLASHMNK